MLTLARRTRRERVTTTRDATQLQMLATDYEIDKINGPKGGKIVQTEAKMTSDDEKELRGGA